MLVLFQVLVPVRIEKIAMRNVHKPQLILDFLTAHPDGFELHGHTKLPPLKGRRRALKKPTLSRVLKFMYICD